MATRLLALFTILTICAHCNSETIDYSILKDAEADLRTFVGRSLKCDSETANKFKKYLSNDTNSLDDGGDWIFPMIDATPIFEIIPSGLLTGNIANYGQFDECMSIGNDIPNKAGINGKYCTFALVIQINKIVVVKSICIPESCNLTPSKLNINKQVTANINGAYCQTKSDDHWEWDDWTVIGVFIGILVIIAISSVYDLYLHYSETKARIPVLIAFSAVTNCKKLFATSNAPGQIHCMHGIRAISMMWIIAGHRFVSISMMPTINFTNMYNFQQSIASSYITSARAAVDTFFLFSAFLVSYIYFKGLRSSMSKAEAKGVTPRNILTLSKIPIYYLHRLLRIMPALIAVYFLNLTVMEHIGSSPLKSMHLISTETCAKWWWTYFLFIQNYVNYKDICVVPTWYISADMQLFFLSPLLLIPLGELIIRGKKKLAYIVIIVVIWISIVVPMTVEFFREFDKLNIYETHHRASVYTIGILFGMFFIDKTDKKVMINHAVNIFLWVLSLGAMLTIVLTMHDTEVDPTLEKNNLFFSISRPIWSVACCWIVFSCHFGYGGCINWFLSLPIYQVATKLSFSMYLLHGVLIYVFMNQIKVTRHFSEYSVIYEWCGDYIMTIIASIVWVLCFESPVVCIEKVLLRTGRRDKQITTVEQTPPVKSVTQIA